MARLHNLQHLTTRTTLMHTTHTRQTWTGSEWVSEGRTAMQCTRRRPTSVPCSDTRSQSAGRRSDHSHPVRRCCPSIPTCACESTALVLLGPRGANGRCASRRPPIDGRCSIVVVVTHHDVDRETDKQL